MRAERLTLAPTGGVRRTADVLILDVQNGVTGDRRSARDGSVSLLSSEAEEEIRGLGGLCTERFLANIVTRGLDYAVLEAGVRMTVGNCELEIVRVGKGCYEVCALRQNGETCPLPKSCAFARVVRGGRIHPDDEIGFAE
jgi:MOSC domain-containing protein YiiM